MQRKKLVDEYKGFLIYRVSYKGIVPFWVVKDPESYIVMENFSCDRWTLEAMRKRIDTYPSKKE